MTDLTPREAEALDLVADGLTNAEIAGRMRVRLDTVKQHLFHAGLKLGTADRLSSCLAAGVLVRPARGSSGNPGAPSEGRPSSPVAGEDRTPLAPRAGGSE